MSDYDANRLKLRFRLRLRLRKNNFGGFSMATIMKLNPKVRIENRALFPSETGTVYLFHLESEDGAKNIMLIWGDVTTVANYNTGPDIGSLLIGTDAGVVYVKTAATTWTKVGTQS